MFDQLLKTNLIYHTAQVSQLTHSEITQIIVWKLRLEFIELGILVVISAIVLNIVWRSLKPLQENLRLLKNFNAELAHELRNFLMAINLACEVMQSHSDKLNSLLLKKLAIINASTEQMICLVDNLSLITQLDAIDDFSGLNNSPVCLTELLQDLAHSFEPQAQQKDIYFEFYLLPGVFVKGDASQLNRLFLNILDNAFKYTATGGRVTMWLEKNKKFAVVGVEDTGIGIGEEYLPFIFQSFWQFNKAKSVQQKDSLGLGLAIAQSIAQKHKGKIEVTSEVGVGSIFQVHIPLL